MATYYKYAERNATSQVNWAEIGKNLTDTLQEENKIREEKKARIDEATRQYGIALEAAPQGESSDLNSWALDYAGNAQEARLLQDRLLKSGKLKLKDYTIMRQNILDGTSQAFGLIDEYNVEYKDKMQRAKSMDPANASQYLEQWLMAQSEGFSNFSKSQLYINPTTFQVNVAMKKEVDGVTGMSADPDEFTTVNALRNRIKSKFDRFNTDNYLKSQVDLLGTQINAYKTAASKTKAGTFGTVEDVKAKDDFAKAETEMINAGLALPSNVSSVLTNDVSFYTDPNTKKQMPFTFTFDPNKQGGNVILLSEEAGAITPKFTEEQMNIARDSMKTKFESMLDYKETINTYANPTPPQPQEWQYRLAIDKNIQKDAVNMLLKLRSGTPSEVQAAVDYFRTVNPQGITNLRRDNNGVTYTDATGTSHYISANDNAADWIRASAGFLIGKDKEGREPDLSEAVRSALPSGNDGKGYVIYDNAFTNYSVKPTALPVDNRSEWEKEFDDIDSIFGK